MLIDSLPDVRIDDVVWHGEECDYTTFTGEVKWNGKMFEVDVKKEVLLKVFEEALLKVFEGILKKAKSRQEGIDKESAGPDLPFNDFPDSDEDIDNECGLDHGY